MQLGKQIEFPFAHTAPTLTPVLKDFVKGPVFAAKSSQGSRQICVDGNIWTIGVEHPIERWSNKSLAIKHGKICFALLEFWKQQDYKRSLKFSIGELCRLYSNGTGKGGRYYRDILEILFDLRDTWVQISQPDGCVERFTIIGDIKVVNTPNGNLILERVDLSPEFFKLLQAIESRAYLRLDILNSLPSSISAAIYTFLPSRAFYHKKENPFQITLATLLQQIGLDVPQTKSQRKKIFVQNAHKKSGSILDQLDGVQLSNGLLRVQISDCADKEDYKLLAWVEPCEQTIPYAAQGKLYKIWCEAGKSPLKFQERISHPLFLNEYEEKLLTICELDIDPIRRFLEKAKTLLGSTEFQCTLASIKADKLENKTPRKNLKAKLIFSLMTAIKKGQ